MFVKLLFFHLPFRTSSVQFNWTLFPDRNSESSYCVSFTDFSNKIIWEVSGFFVCILHSYLNLFNHFMIMATSNKYIYRFIYILYIYCQANKDRYTQKFPCTKPPRKGPKFIYCDFCRRDDQIRRQFCLAANKRFSNMWQAINIW